MQGRRSGRSVSAGHKIMWLAQWMRENEVGERQFGDHIGVSGAYVNRIKSGQNFPGVRIRRAIFKKTGGKVTANDLAAAHDAYKELPPVETLLPKKRPAAELEPAQ